jgi:D-beta-D-heptose 7-phosphate kinase/D-beta-D-heptose 1-phosphate adenosyltransferase
MTDTSKVVTVVGDVMLDRYFDGSVDRISPEAPVPVLRVKRRFHRPGGAANVAANLRSLGAIPRLVGLVGIDETASALAEALGEASVETNWLARSASFQTTAKTRLLSGQFQIARFDDEVAPSAADVDLCEAAVRAAAAESDAIIISDYAKGVCHERVCRAAIEVGRRRAIPVVVDPKDADFSKYSGATVITPNRKEAVAASGTPITSPEQAIDAARVLHRRYSFAWIVVTLGEQGMVAVSDSEAFAIPTHAKRVFDVTGAGDTVVAALGVCLARGMQMTDACRYANIAAGIQVSQVGTSQVHWSDVLHAESVSASRAFGKILDLDPLLAAVRAARAEGKKVGFTNGCFDILHHGHVALLEAAAKECDELIVAVNSDASVTRLKGAPRPFVPASYRKAVLAALESVAYVTEFDADTPLDLIKAIRPDVLIKGADYKPADVVGGDIVEAAGGRVATPLFVPEVSTTNIVDRILSSVAPRAPRP